jgi:hypothetical protein
MHIQQSITKGILNIGACNKITAGDILSSSGKRMFENKEKNPKLNHIDNFRP